MSEGSIAGDASKTDGLIRGLLPFIPSIVTALGVVVYGALTLTYARFYADLNITPDDVGLGYATTLTHSIGIVLLIATVLGIGSGLLGLRGASTRTRQKLIRLYQKAQEQELEA